MRGLYWLTDAQIARLQPYFPKSNGQPRVDDRRNLFESAPHGIEPGSKKGDVGRRIGRTKDWRRVATRYDKCPTVFLSAIALAATVIFWL